MSSSVFHISYTISYQKDPHHNYNKSPINPTENQSIMYNVLCGKVNTYNKQLLNDNLK